MGTIPQWTGKEIRALRSARRMSVRDFAEHLGVSDRMVSKWEAGGDGIRPRSKNQRALDASLRAADPGIQARFESLAGGVLVAVEDFGPERVARNLVRHPVDGKLMTLVEAGPYAPDDGEAVWVPGYYIDVQPTTCAEYGQFVRETDHRPPAGWVGRVARDAMLEAPVQVPWMDAQTYAAWAGKVLPSPVQWDRAVQGGEGMLAGNVAEWCTTHRGPRRHQPSPGTAGGQPGFRCVVPLEEMLALLLI